MSACSAVGFMNRSACTKKSSAASASRPRALSPWAITRFAPKFTSPAGPVGTALEGRGVEVLAGDELEARGTQRALRHAERLGALVGREQVRAVDRVGGHAGESTLPPGASKLPMRA